MTPLPAQRKPEPKVVDPEIVGLETPPSPWSRFLTRAVISLAVGAIGLALCLAGLVLTLTIIGASIGLALLGIGLCLILLATLVLFSGKAKTTFIRFP